MDVLQSGAAANPRVFIFLLQLGGPKTLADIPAFLEELFDDVLPLPKFLRRRAGRLIAKRRTPEVTPLYEEIGGGSPLLANTEAQAEALIAGLAERGIQADVGLAMRYAPPRLDVALKAARALGPDVPWLALPLYPQYSYATTRSSLDEMYDALRPDEFERLHVVEAYPAQPRYLDALADTVVQAVRKLPSEVQKSAKVLFSAHGLPMRLVNQGDPYPRHIERTLTGAVARVEATLGHKLDHELSYQSRVGPVKWLTPSTEDTLKRMGAEGVKTVAVVPIAFVSEHIETLHELDIQLRETAQHAGVEHYTRAPTVSVHPAFIEALCQVTQATLQLGPQALAVSRCGACPGGKCKRRLPQRCAR